jgi:hypothetical protein
MDQDPWVGVWHVYGTSPDSGGSYLGPGDFTLEAVLDEESGETAFYRISDMTGMPSCWEGMRFFPRGSAFSKKPPNVLPKHTPKCDKDWEAAAGFLRQSYGMKDGCIPGINPELVRLEADMFPRGKAEALTLVRVPSVAEDKSDLLVLMLKSKDQSYNILEDGTAHGGGPPH